MRSFFFPRKRVVRSRPAFVRLETLESREVPATFNALTPQNFGSALNNNGCVATGDFDKNGKQDVVLANYGPSGSTAGDTIAVLWGDGAGSFNASPYTIDTDPGNPDHVSFVAVADMNGDGWQDIVSVQTHVGTPDSTFTVFLNTGVSTFVALTPVDTNGRNAAWVGVADFNYDGIPDIGICNMGEPVGSDVINENSIDLFVGVDGGGGKGDGTFALSQHITTTFELISTAGVFVDINGDSKLDLVVTMPAANPELPVEQTPGKLGLLFNDGGGVFSISATYPGTGGPLPISISSADLDGNGSNDILVANAGDPDNGNFGPGPNFGAGSNFGYLMNDGFGGFASAKTIANTALRAGFGVVAGDFNGDTKQDAALVSYGRPAGIDDNFNFFSAINGNLVVFNGNGAGAFTIDSGTPYQDTSDGTQFLTVGDFTGDLKPDIVTVGAHNQVRMHVNITTPNTPPTIGSIADQNGTAGTTTGPIPFTVGDAETPVANLTLSATSSNTTVMPLSKITFGGSGANRTVSLQVPTGVTGTSLITITVTDTGGQTASTSFTLNAGANTVPGISDIGDVKVSAGTSVGPISFLIGDNESPATSLTLKAASNNPALIPTGSITFGGSGALRTISFPTVPGFAGSTTITVTVTDPGGLSASDSFVVTQTIGASINSITSTSSNGTYTTGQNVNVSINFSESVTLSGGNMTVNLDSGGSLSIAPFTGTTASGTYTILSGQTSPDLNVTGLTLAGGASLVTTAGAAPVSLSLPSSNLANNQNIIVNPPPPTTVSFISVNNGATQRSRITSLTLTFNNPVNAANFTAAGAITLTRTAATKQGTVGTVVQTGATGAFGRINISPGTGMVTSLTLTFDNANGAAITAGVENGSLADGRWQLAIPSLGYTSALNDVNLRRLYGDSDGNGFVDAADFAVFGGAFNSSNPTFDFDSNGSVDSVDLAQFGNRFGITL